MSIEAGPVPKTISIYQPTIPDTLYSGQRDTIILGTTGKISRRKSFFYSLDSGRTLNAIGTDTGFTIGSQFGYAWTVPTVYNPDANVLIVVSDSEDITGSSSTFVVMPCILFPPSANLIHYWHFNAFSGQYSYTSVPALPSDYSAVSPGKAAISFQLEAGASPYSYPGYVQGVPGTITNDQMHYPIGQALEIGNPSDSVEMHFYIPSTNHENISVHYALQASGGTTGPIVQIMDYSIDSGRTWRTTALKQTVDTINRAPFINGGWGYVSADLSSDLQASDNPNLVFRLRFAGNNFGKSGFVKIDNVSVEGPVGQVVIAGAPTLVHYWNFNKLGTYKVPNVPLIKADYSILDTNQAYLEYYLDPGTSNTFGAANGSDNIDPVASADTANLRQGAVAGNALRVRNPVDSIQLRWHIPSTGYQNLVVKFVVESSSTTSGDSTQVYSYSIDGGASWKTTGMTVNGFNIDTLDVTGQAQYQGSSWGLVTVTFGSDATVNNNPNLVFRITYRGNTHLLSGNNRYDDLTMDGVPLTGAETLINYWNFNKLGTYKVPNVPLIKSDYSIIDTNQAYLEYYLIPGTSNTFGAANGSDNIDPVASADTSNLRQGAVAGNALRVRNPVDSIQLRWHIPSTGYQDLTVKFVVESSSTTSGDSTQVYAYSIDGGSTWKTTGMTVNGFNIDTLDVTDQAQYQGASWGLVTVTFGTDTTVNNNPNLIFRITYRGNTHLLSGNNRYDDFTVDGVPVGSTVKPPLTPGNIVVSFDGKTSPSPLDTVYAGTKHTISYTASGTVTPSRTIEYSIDNGRSWTVIAANVSSTSYTWTVPTPQSNNALVRVIDGEGVVGISPKFVIFDSGKINNIWISSNDLRPSQSASVLWNTSGYLGETANIDVSLDGQKTWSSIVGNYVFGTNTSYPWTAPSTPDSGIVIRMTFATGVVGYSKPFNVLAPSSVADGSTNSQVHVWPNPLHTQTTIRYELAASENVSLSIHDLVGREVESTQEGMQSAGEHEITFDGSREPAGVYLYELTAGDLHYRGQLVIVR